MAGDYVEHRLTDTDIVIPYIDSSALIAPSGELVVINTTQPAPNVALKSPDTKQPSMEELRRRRLERFEPPSPKKTPEKA